MNNIYKSTIYLLIALFTISCQKRYKNTIVISCISCKQCVESIFSELKESDLSSKYTLYFDSICTSKMNDISDITFIHLDSEMIVKKHSRFANVLFYDAIGEKHFLNSKKELKKLMEMNIQ